MKFCPFIVALFFLAAGHSFVTAQQPTVCDEVVPSTFLLWPPRGDTVEVALGFLDDAAAANTTDLTIEVTGVTQDENPSADAPARFFFFHRLFFWMEWLGMDIPQPDDPIPDGTPDAELVPPDTVRLQVERIREDNGRVYHIHFKVMDQSDPPNEECKGKVFVCVPHALHAGWGWGFRFWPFDQNQNQNQNSLRGEGGPNGNGGNGNGNGNVGNANGNGNGGGGGGGGQNRFGRTQGLGPGPNCNNGVCPGENCICPRGPNGPEWGFSNDADHGKCVNDGELFDSVTGESLT